MIEMVCVYKISLFNTSQCQSALASPTHRVSEKFLQNYMTR